MNQSSNETHGMSLPAPVAETQPDNFSVQENAAQSHEQVAAAPEKASVAAMPAMPMPPAIPQDNQTNVTADDNTDDVQTTSKSVVQKVIEDKDLIDKAWVEKAKAIIERNREDPYKQTEGLTEVKAEFLEKNYNKTIKLSK